MHQIENHAIGSAEAVQKAEVEVNGALLHISEYSTANLEDALIAVSSGYDEMKQSWNC